MNKPDKIYQSPQYTKGVKRLQKINNKSAYQSLITAVQLLSEGHELPPRYRNHKLKGVTNQWECHIDADILLVYQYDQEQNLLILKLLDPTNHDSLSRKANLRGTIEFEHVYVY